MAIYEFKLPDIGEGVVEGEVVTWHVSVGDTVSEDDAVVDVMTDKATVTIPSPTDGTVVSLNGEVGDMIAVGSVLIEFETIEGDTVPGNPVEDVPVEMEDTPVETAPPREEERKPELEKPSRKTITPAPQIAPVIPKGTGGPILASPAVRKRAREAGINLGTLSGSGPAGRIRHADIDAFVAGGGAVMGAPPLSLIHI